MFFHSFTKADENSWITCTKSRHVERALLSGGLLQQCTLSGPANTCVWYANKRLRTQKHSFMKYNINLLCVLCSPVGSGCDRTPVMLTGTWCDRRLPWWCVIHGRTAHVVPARAARCSGRNSSECASSRDSQGLWLSRKLRLCPWEINNHISV